MIQKALAYGLTLAFRGLRQGRPGMAGVGAAMAIASWLRNRKKPGDAPVFRTRLRDGQALRIRYLEGDEVVAEAEVKG